MDLETVKRIGSIIVALLASWTIAGYLSHTIGQMIGLSGPELALASFLLYAVFFLLVLSGFRKILGISIFDNRRLA